MDKHDYMSMKKDIKYLKGFLNNHYDGEYNINKPIAWIYLPFETNSMVWDSFYSRNTKHLNNTLLREIVNKNTSILKDKFNVLLIDDDSFKHILDDKLPDLKAIGAPLKDKLVDLYVLQLIETYGGIRIPNHFAIQDDTQLYNMLYKTTEDTVVCFRKPHSDTLIYDIQFIGSLFNNNKTIKKLIQYQQLLIGDDTGDASNFVSTSLPSLVSNNILDYDITESGVKDINNHILTVEDFMSETKNIEFPPNTFMIYLPLQHLSKRTHYNWITYIASSYPNQISRFL